MKKTENSDTVLLFDGECNLCNKTVQFVIQRDKKARVKYASLQSDYGKSIMRQYNIPEGYVDSIVFFHKNKIYYKSRAALELSLHLDGLWFLLYIFALVPPVIRNWGYNFIAKNRYKWFGKTDTCWVMTKDLKDRFIE